MVPRNIQIAIFSAEWHLQELIHSTLYMFLWLRTYDFRVCFVAEKLKNPLQRTIDSNKHPLKLRSNRTDMP